MASYGLDGMHRGQTAHVGEQALGALAVRLPAVDAAAARHAHRHRRGELGARAVSQAGGLGDQLIEPGIDVVGELDLDHRAQAVGPHADRGADDATFGDRGVEHPLAAVLGLQPLGAAEDTAEVADVLAEHDDVVVALHHHVDGRADGRAHRHRGHRSSSICWRWRWRCGGITLNTSSKMLLALATRPSSSVP